LHRLRKTLQKIGLCIGLLKAEERTKGQNSGEISAREERRAAIKLALLKSIKSIFYNR